MQEKTTPIWQSIITKSPLTFSKGELLTPCIPHNHNSLIFIVEHVDEQGLIHLKPHSSAIVDNDEDNVAFAVKHEELIRSSWYFANTGVGIRYFGANLSLQKVQSVYLHVREIDSLS